MLKPVRHAALLAALLLALPALAQAPPRAYDSEGRRDPFRPAGTTDGSRSCPADAGLLSVQSDHVRLRGLIMTDEGAIAALESAAVQGTLPARVGDRLCDGRVERIDFETKTVVLRIERDHPLRPWRDRTLSLDSSN